MLSRDIENTANFAEQNFPRSPARDTLIHLLNDLAADAHALETAAIDSAERFEPIDADNIVRLFPSVRA